MLKNYLKIIFNVLMRRKLFTIISLFGISITMTILLIGASFYDAVLKPNYPANKGKRIGTVDRIHFYEEKGNNEYTGSPGYYFLDQCVKPLKTPEKISIVSDFFVAVNTYTNNKRIKLDIKYVDENFWQILDFDFLEGRPFHKKEVKNAEPVAVINESTAKEYFGTRYNVIGKTIEVNKITYKITGVVRDVSILNIDYYGELWVPLTTKKENLTRKELGGNFIAIVLAPKDTDLPKIDQELQQAIRKFEPPDTDRIKFIEMHVEKKIDSIIKYGLNLDFTIFQLLLSTLIVIFLLIPSLNLMNMNVSRIKERNSEIGIRKSFGAAKITLIGQFLTENFILTLLGSILAVFFSVIILYLIESSEAIPYADLHLNIRVLSIWFMISLVFSFLSGFLPAYRMARLQIIDSLKGGVS